MTDNPVKRILCEVYSRIVGYLRPVQDWNKGKQQEFEDRIDYDALKAADDAVRAALNDVARQAAEATDKAIMAGHKEQTDDRHLS